MKIASPIAHRRPRLEIIPLIDIMFFLLAAFMMVSLTMHKNHCMPVNLEGAANVKNDFKPDAVTLSVDREGKVYVERELVTLPDLRALLLKRVKDNPAVTVYLAGDRDTPHGRMISVLDFVRGAGVQKVAFTVKTAAAR
ncbi:MAG: ExbD/TolR family protein [Opitutales bacterium]